MYTFSNFNQTDNGSKTISNLPFLQILLFLDIGGRCSSL